MTVSADIWQARAAMCELLALSFRYPEDKVLAEAIASGEWGEAADEIAGALGIDWTAAAAPGAAEAAALPDPDDIQKELRPEATRLFVGAPEAACSPYEGVWRAKTEGVQFVNPHSMAVERFCKACGLGRPEGTNEPLDAVWTELELLEYLALRAAADAMDAAAEDDLAAGGDGAPTEEQAEQMAKAVVRSPLVKCAVFGTDANWGRVLCAIGYSGAQFDPKDVEVKFLSRAGELLVCAGGQGVAFDEALAKRVLSEDEVVIQVTLTSGSATCSCWGCDLTYDYVRINGDYRT